MQTSRRRRTVPIAITFAVLVIGLFYLRGKPHPSKESRASSEEAPSTAQDPSIPSGTQLDASDLAAGRERAESIAPVSERRPEAGALVVRVTTELDRPVAAAHVLLFDAKALLGSATSGADGTCSFPASEGEGGIVAWMEGRAPVRQATSLSPGKTTIRFPDGARVSGSARLTDGSPATKLGLLLRTDRAFISIDDLPLAVREALPKVMNRGTAVEIPTDDAGRFAFVGLDPAWKGGIFVARSHWLVESSQGSLRHEGAIWPYESGVALDAPVDALVLTLLELPAITGRIVTSDGRAPVPRAQLEWIIRVLDVDGAASPPAGSCRLDESGRFRIAVDPINSLRTSAWIERHELPRLSGIWIEATDAEGGSKIQREIKLQQPRGPWDLGDIPLAAMRTLAFVVRDTAGRPVAGAVGRTRGWGPSKPTDAEGRGHAEGLPEEASDWIVGAAGFAVTTVALPSDPSATLEIVIAKSNELVVHVRAESGSLPEGIKVQIASQSPMFARGADRKPDWGPDRVQTSTGSSDSRGGQSGPQGGYSEFPLDPAGRVILRCLVPSRPFSIRVQAAAGNTLHEEEVTGLGAEESRTLEVALRSVGHDLMGRVVDSNGTPVNEVSVSLQKDIWWTGARSNSLGEFRIEGLGSGPFKLVVEKPGYATIVDPNYEPPANAVELRLDAGHQVRVRVVDTAGQLVKDCEAGISDANGEYAHSRRPEPGVFEFPDLPPTNLTFSAFVGGVRYPKEHSALDPELTIEVPVHGSLEIRIPEAIGFHPGGTVRLFLAPRGAGAAAADLDLTPMETSTTRVRFGAVLPGEFEARLEHWSKREGSEDWDWMLVGQAQSIVVKAGEETIADWSR